MKVAGIGTTSQRPWLWMPSCKPGRREGGVGWAGLGWASRNPRFPLPLGGGATQPSPPQLLSSRLLPRLALSRKWSFSGSGCRETNVSAPGSGPATARRARAVLAPAGALR